jgi:hypothetical protein
MLRKKAKSLSELIEGADSTLGHLAQEAKRRTDIGDYLRNRLPAELAEGLIYCNFQADDTLILIASRPEWAARLRFEAERVKELCREYGSPVVHVKVRVATN